MPTNINSADQDLFSEGHPCQVRSLPGPTKNLRRIQNNLSEIHYRTNLHNHSIIQHCLAFSYAYSLQHLLSPTFLDFRNDSDVEEDANNCWNENSILQQFEHIIEIPFTIQPHGYILFITFTKLRLHLHQKSLQIKFYLVHVTLLINFIRFSF